MDAVIAAVTSVLSMFTSVFNFVVSTPLLLVLIIIPLVGTVIWIITSLFRRG